VSFEINGEGGRGGEGQPEDLHERPCVFFSYKSRFSSVGHNVNCNILEFWVVHSRFLREGMVTNATKEIEEDKTSND
jgi:hypothetical protein